MRTKCIIVDDEPLAIEVIESYIQKIDSLELAAKCSTAMEAFNILRAKQIDLIFLDIQMPELTGLDFLKALAKPPKIIITTAHRKYAIEGFELDVLDYLLKPISFERFLKAIDKYNKSAENESSVTQPQISSGEEEFIYVKANKKVIKISITDIIFIEGLKDYVVIHTPEQKIIAKSTMIAIEKKLPGDKFLRIHRSYIVSLLHIDAFTATSIEIGKKELTIGRSYKQSVMKALQYYGKVNLFLAMIIG